MSSTTTNNGVFRRKKVYFTQVSNNILRDNEISLKAKGLYSLIQSYITIEDFVLYKNFLIKQCKEGERAFESAWKELKDNGYLVQYKLKGDKGTFYYEYELLDVPENNSKNKEIKEKKPDLQNSGMDYKKPDIQNVGVDNADVDNVCGGTCTPAKQGVYNNTNSTNTDFNNTNSTNTDRNNTNSNAPSTTNTPIEKFFSLMKNEMTDVSFKTWIEPLIIHITNEKAIIETKEEFITGIIKDRYLDLIKKNFSAIGINEIDIKEKND